MGAKPVSLRIKSASVNGVQFGHSMFRINVSTGIKTWDLSMISRPAYDIYDFSHGNNSFVIITTENDQRKHIYQHLHISKSQEAPLTKTVNRSIPNEISQSTLSLANQAYQLSIIQFPDRGAPV